MASERFKFIIVVICILIAAVAWITSHETVRDWIVANEVILTMAGAVLGVALIVKGYLSKPI